MDFETLQHLATMLNLVVTYGNNAQSIEIALQALPERVILRAADELTAAAAMLTYDADRKLVCEALHYSTASMAPADRHWQNQAWAEADGFGRMSLADIADQDFDWSHVRDSSPQAFARMAEVVRTHRDQSPRKAA